MQGLGVSKRGDRRCAAVIQSWRDVGGRGLKSGWAEAGSKRRGVRGWGLLGLPRQDSVGAGSASWREAVFSGQCGQRNGGGVWGGWTVGFARRGLRPTLAAKAPAGERSEYHGLLLRSLHASCALRSAAGESGRPAWLSGPAPASGCSWDDGLDLAVAAAADFSGCQACEESCHGAGSWLCPAVFALGE